MTITIVFRICRGVFFYRKGGEGFYPEHSQFQEVIVQTRVGGYQNRVFFNELQGVLESEEVPLRLHDGTCRMRLSF